MKYLSLDMGERKVGLAGSDSGIVATPLPALEMGPAFMQQLGEVIALEKPELLIFGLPHHLNGDETEFAKNIKELALGIHHEFGVKVDFEDEFGSTKEAEDRLKAMGVSGREICKFDDSMAAAIILENYLARN